VIESRRVRWVEHVAYTGEKIKVYRILVGKPEGEGPLGRPRCRWEDNIKMNFKEIRLEGVDWSNVAWNRDVWQAVVNRVMTLWVTSMWKIF
jgi:hypothetical protein